MITVSIVSHGHAELVEDLLKDIARCPEVSHVVLTFNIPEREIAAPSLLLDRLIQVHNAEPKGFGANHNAAFTYCTSPYFCIVNPDVRVTENPFSSLLSGLKDSDVALAAPAVISPTGTIEDSVRHFPTFFGLLCRALHISEGRYLFTQKTPPFAADWVAGMFMLLKAAEFTTIGGFDEGFYLYCEDVDLCARFWKSGRKILVYPSTSVIHDARRSSHRNLKYFFWHVSSLVRYFTKHSAHFIAFKRGFN